MTMAIGTLVLGAVASYMGYSQMTSAEAEVAQLKSQVKDEKEVQKELDASKTKVLECSDKLKHLEAGVPDFAYVPTLMTELEKTGKQYGIQILGVRPVPKPIVAGKKDDSAKSKPAYDELTIEVKGFGSYGSIMRFVNSLTEFPKIIAARSVQLTPKADPGATRPDLDMVVELRAYVFADGAKTTSSVDSPAGAPATTGTPATGTPAAGAPANGKPAVGAPKTAPATTKDAKTASLKVKRNEG